MDLYDGLIKFVVFWLKVVTIYKSRGEMEIVELISGIRERKWKFLKRFYDSDLNFD